MEPPTKKVKQAASRRAPYATAACDYCHGRKLKCSGDRPCHRCKKQDISCSYPTKSAFTVTRTDSSLSQQPLDDQDGNRVSETLLTSIDDLQGQLDDLKTKLRGAMASGLSLSAFASPPEALQQIRECDRNRRHESDLPKREPANLDVYAGPTSFTFGMVTADARLANLTPSSRDLTTTGSPSPAQVESHQLPDPPFEQARNPNVHDGNSLENFTVEDVFQCLDVFQQVYGVLHAIPQLEKIRVNAPSILRSAKRSLWSQPTTPGRCGLLEMMKVILATALVAQVGGKTKLSNILYRSVEPTVIMSAFQHTITYDLRTLLLLVAMYHFANDDLVLGARTIMYAARTAIEEGLYRIDKLTAGFPDQKEREAIIRQLWSLFVLDRQFNFAAGLPHHLNDNDVDLPTPVDAPYLAGMVSYVIMGAQAWTSLVNRNLLAGGQAPTKDAVNFFHYQIHQWHEDLEPSVRFNAAAIESNDHLFLTSTQDETEIYLKTLLYLRSNQIQILVLRPILIYPQTARNNTALITDAISLAKKSIRTLNTLATETDIYRTRQAIFNHFLSSALTVLFLAAAYDAESLAAQSALPAMANTMLGDAVNELQAGLNLIDYLRSTSQSASDLGNRFDRPRQQLIRLGILQSTVRARHPTNKRHLHSGGEGYHEEVLEHPNATDTTAEAGLVAGFDPSAPLDFDLGDLKQGNNLPWLDWFEGGFMDSSVPFGMPAWM